MNAIHSVVFDMDGVIVNSEPLHVEAERATFRRFGLDITEDEWIHFKGKTSRDIFNQMLHKYGQDPGQTEAMVNHKTDYYLKTAPRRLNLIPGARAGLETCRALPVKMALTTSSQKALQEMTFQVFSLDRFFDVVVTGDDIRQGKPHPEPYLVTAERLGMAPSRCLVIEDSDHGIRSAGAAGCVPVGITTTLSRQRLLASGAERVVDRFDELEAVVRERAAV